MRGVAGVGRATGLATGDVVTSWGAVRTYREPTTTTVKDV